MWQNIVELYRHPIVADLLRWLFFLALVVVLLLSVLPLPQSGGPEFGDKIAHGFCFLLLASLYAAAFGMAPLDSAVMVSLLSFGLLLELIQFFLPWRSFSLADLAADLAGLLLFQGVAWFFLRREGRI